MRTTGFFWKEFDSPEEGLIELKKVSYVACGCIGKATSLAESMNTLCKGGGTTQFVSNGWHYTTLRHFVFGYRQMSKRRYLFFVRHPLGCSMSPGSSLALSAGEYGWNEMLFSPIWGEQRDEGEVPTPEDVFNELNRIRS